MPKSTSADFHPEVMKLFDKYVHGFISRRDFIDGAGRFAVGTATGLSLLQALSPQFAAATQVQPDDARISARYVEFDSPQGYGKSRGYLVMPAKPAGPLPGVLVVHENRGLNPHIEDIARRLALAGFIAFAPDALTPLGGYPGDEDKARELFPRLDQAKVREDFLAAAAFLKAQPGLNGHYGAVGFCFGGGIVNFLATHLPDLGAAVPFYGAAPDSNAVANIRAPLLIQYAENDERINSMWPGYEAALKAAGVHYQMYRYPGTQHGFNNDTTPRFDAEQARIAWERTLAFFNEHLRS